MPIRLRRAGTLAALIAALAAAVFGAVQAPARPVAARHHKKHKPKHCKRGRARIRRKHSKRVLCVKVKAPHGAPAVTAVHELRAMLGEVPLRAHRRHHARHLPKTLGKALSAHHVKPAIIEQVLRRARVADVFPGPTLDGWDTTVDTSGSEGSVTVTAKREGATMSMSYTDDAKLDECPDADGDVAGSRVLDITFDVDAKDKRGRAKLHFEAKATAKFTGHLTDEPKVRDFDVDPFKMYEYIRGEQYDASGKLVLSTPPILPNVAGGVRGLDLGHTSADDLNRGGNVLSGTAPPEIGQKGLQSLLGWAQFEIARSVREANDRLTDEQTHGWSNCLGVSVTAANTTLAPGESTTLTVTVAPRHGSALAPARLTANGGAGTVTPGSATATGQPQQFTFTAPTSGWKGTSPFFSAASKQGQGYGDVALAATPPNHYVLVFTHASHSDDTHTVDNPTFQGTSTHHEAYDLTARIPLSGDPSSATATGTGAIGYTKAEYHDEQDGTFHGQGTCVGSDRTDLTAAHGGTAHVLGVRVSGGSVSLDFAPGAFGSSGDGPPDETYRNVQSYDACPGADTTTDEALFLNRFRNQYDSSGWVYGSNQHVHLASGWKPGSGDVVATLDVTPSGSWSDHYEIDRVP